MSASAKMISGFLPPSSIDTFSNVADAAAIAARPTTVDPVNEIDARVGRHRRADLRTV